MRTLLLATAALVAAVLVFALATLPPRRMALASFDDGTVPGILHVHSNRSDGLSSPDDIAAAAARAGLKFVIFTDHGDATRTPDPPTYRSGVLCLDGVEISTSGGHYIAIDMHASPYPLGGEARDVVEDVRRLGGFGIVAHPDSPKPQLRWVDWTAPFDGVELLNPDTSWRVLAAQPGWRMKARLLTAVLDYPFRAPEVIAHLIQPTAALETWAAVAARRRVVTIAGADAHAKLAFRNADPGDSSFALPLPGYEPTFRVMSVHVRLPQPLTGRAADDASALTRAIRSGHVYTAIDGVATPPSFEFTATNALGTVSAGDVIGVGGAVLLHIRSNAPNGFTTVVHDGARILSSARESNDVTVHGPATAGVFWAEVLSASRDGQPLTWIRSNPIYVRALDASAPSSPPTPTPTSSQSLFSGTADGWRTEQDAHSLSAVDLAGSTAGPELRYRFGLADGPPIGQFTALVRDLPNGAATYDRIHFSIRAERPMRISLQIRDSTADRWQRSIYIDSAQQEKTVALRDFVSVGITHVQQPTPESIRAVMFVVDTTNTKTGASGRIWIRDAALQR